LYQKVIDNLSKIYYLYHLMSKLQRKLFFLALFSILGFLSLQIPFNKLLGSNVSFTLFDFFAPIAGAFLGPVYGIISVLSVMLANNFMKDIPWTTGTIIRLFPTLFAVYYFATIKKSPNNWIFVVPVLSIIAFLLSPVGLKVPYYTFFWFIPLIAYKYRNNLYMRSLGATFTAHSVGGAAWVWAFNLPASVWQGLIPVVVSERLLFAAGISISYVLISKALTFLVSKKLLPSLDHVVS